MSRHDDSSSPEDSSSPGSTCSPWGARSTTSWMLARVSCCGGSSTVRWTHRRPSARCGDAFAKEIQATLDGGAARRPARAALESAQIHRTPPPREVGSAPWGSSCRAVAQLPRHINNDRCWMPAGWFIAGGDPDAEDRTSRRTLFVGERWLRRYGHGGRDSLRRAPQRRRRRSRGLFNAAGLYGM